MREKLRWLRAAGLDVLPDWEDVRVFGGIALIWYGLAQFSFAVSFIVVGCIVVALPTLRRFF